MKRQGISLAIIGIAAFLFGTSSAFAQIPLGTSGNFAVLGGSAVTNTGASVIPGNLAQNDLATAYNTAVGIPCGTDLSS